MELESRKRMQRQYLNEGWQFIDNFREEYIRTAFHESDESADLYQTIRIPHTVKEVPFHYFDEEEYQMVSTYRRMLYIPKEWEKKSIILTFEGAAHKAEVYVNGQRAAEHACGYTAFSIELSGFVEYGKENLLVVKLDSRESLNIPPFGFVIDYMTFGGIYRDVYLEIGEQTHISDIFVRTQLLVDDHAKLRVDLTLYENLKLINSYKGVGISIYLQPDRTGDARDT